jgi:YibE/F-like protein
MRIGRDHIASTVYTIAFATAGASLGVFLLIKINSRPLLDLLQAERFAAELLSILVGSIGLVLAVPLTTAIGVAVVRASGPGRFSFHRPGPTPVRTRGPAVVQEPVPSKQPDRRPQETPQPPETTTTLRRTDGSPQPEPDPQATPQPQEATTTQLPRASVPPQPAPSNGGETAVPGGQAKRRRSRRRAEDDDFGDFSYLHEASESEPQTPGARGRRAL